jgi:hypothetical protein
VILAMSNVDMDTLTASAAAARSRRTNVVQSYARSAGYVSSFIPDINVIARLNAIVAMPAIARVQAYPVVKQTLLGDERGSVRRRYEE